MKNLIAILGVVVFVISLKADTITMKSGRVVKGVVLQKDEVNTLVLCDYGTQWLTTSEIKEIEADPGAVPKTTIEKSTTQGVGLPDWKMIVRRLADSTWARGLRQIPATVIDKGVLKDVPYISFRCGGSYEANIYGDLDKPAAIEMGIYAPLLDDKTAQTHIISFVSSLLTDPADREALSDLNRAGASVVRHGLVFEITPHTAEDAYGGWWVSIYSSNALQDARVTGDELQAISVANDALINTKAVDPQSVATLRPTGAQTVPSHPVVPESVGKTLDTSPDLLRDTWYYGSTTRSRPAASGGRIWVNSYYRKDGTFVQGYSRRR